MLSIRKKINNNKLYAWMIIAMLFIQAYSTLTHVSLPVQEPLISEETVSPKVGEAQVDSALIQKMLMENPALFMAFNVAFFLIAAILLLGVVFLVMFIVGKVDKTEPIPRTLKESRINWSWKDVLRIVIIFMFFDHMIFLTVHHLKTFFDLSGIDKRISTVFNTLFMEAFVLFLIIYFVKVKYKQKIVTLGISLKNLAKNIKIALVNYIAFTPILAVVFFIIVYIAKVLNYTPGQEPIYDLIFKEQRPTLLIMISVMMTFIGPIMEEVFFRGFLYPALKKSMSIASAIFLSAFIFSMVHTSAMGFLPIVVLGAFLAYLREKTGSLMPSIIVHIIHNTALALLAVMTRGAMAIGVGH